jgi:hypothetical protein
VVPITRGLFHYMELASDAVKRKTGEGGSHKGAAR